MPKPDICIIMNPASGKKKDDRTTQALIARMRDDARIDLRLINHPRQLTRMVKTAVADGFGTIVAAGGDGTIAGVTSVLVDHDVTLGVLPMGTFNFVARGLGIPEEPEAALDVILAGHTTPLNLGDVNGRIFLNNASLGAYATILDVREGVYKQWGRSRIAAYWSVIKAMLTLYRPERMTVTVDGKEMHLRSPMAFVATSAYQLEQYEFEGADAIRAGKLVLILAPDANRIKLLLRAVKILMGRISRGHDYIMHVGDEITVATRRKRQLVARDGENARMTGPYVFKVRHAAVQVCVPQADAEATS